MLEQFIAFISQPWPWWVGGPMIAFILFLLLYFGKEFGLSANLRVMCAADGADKYSDFFEFNWQDQGWNLMVVLGALFGGYVAANHLSGETGQMAGVSQATIASLHNIGLEYEYGKVPIVLEEVYNWKALFTLRGFLIIVGGGFLIGFGSRYAGGCTSGHAISGLSALQLPSLVAVIGFFAGGLIMTYLVLPWLMALTI
jgi:uncharacterized protein